jgi:hypothetical protein
MLYDLVSLVMWFFYHNFHMMVVLNSSFIPIIPFVFFFFFFFIQTLASFPFNPLIRGGGDLTNKIYLKFLLSSY